MTKLSTLAHQDVRAPAHAPIFVSCTPFAQLTNACLLGSTARDMRVRVCLCALCCANMLHSNPVSFVRVGRA